jgi:hypothetical protein
LLGSTCVKLHAAPPGTHLSAYDDANLGTRTVV